MQRASAPTPDIVELGELARLTLWHTLLGPDSLALLETLTNQLPWQRPRITLFGRAHVLPRMQCWMGDSEAHYRYSGLQLVPEPWHADVATVRKKIQSLTGQRFNAVLINLYRDGSDRMGWHSDDEPELGEAPWLASYNLGASRDFALRRKGETRQERIQTLEHDQLMLMNPAVQRHWQHALPVRKKVSLPRINMTFRLVTPRVDPLRV